MNRVGLLEQTKLDQWDFFSVRRVCGLTGLWTHLLVSTAFHKSFNNILVEWQQERTIDQLSQRITCVCQLILGGIHVNGFFNEYFLFVTYATAF